MEKRFLLRRINTPTFHVGDMVTVKVPGGASCGSELGLAEVISVDHPFLWIRFADEPFSVRFHITEVGPAAP